ncbi:amino acid/amide ABC transporter substrate-binding protein (HAAT family) [Flavobacteriaceae bacterium MAR_2010_72]|nr:amino acid/amide ABC transporter substrate-binding protein (HAAT family) [Flavobacteriaceae bacterium MAR_2010_72]
MILALNRQLLLSGSKGFNINRFEMKKIVLIALVTFMFNIVANAQSFVKHNVQVGESIEDISKLYLVTPFDIYALNPDAKKGISQGTTLVIPITKIDSKGPVGDIKEVIGFKTIKVGRKETLYNISKEYDIPIEDIKKHNSFLYSETLKKGDKLKLPRYKTIVSQVTLANTLKTYIVQPKEGKWRVAYKFGLTIPQLEALNPKMNEVLQPGDELIVPNMSNVEETQIDERFNYYTVLKSEGFMALNRKLGVTQQELEALNPGLAETGLKLGMILKIPSDSKLDYVVEDVANTNLSKNIKNFGTKKLALMLPFRLNRIDIDSVAEAKSAIKNDGYLSLSLDFHSGVLIALDSAKQLGISTHLKVFDTRNQISEVGKILNSDDFSDYDAVIGPLMAPNFERVASQLKTNHIPVVSPFTMPEHLYDNVFQTIPTEEMLEKAIVNYVKADSVRKNIIIIADEKHRSKSNRLKAEFPGAKQLFSKKDKDGKDLYYLVLDELKRVFRPGQNLVFIETKNSGFISNATSMLNGLNGQKVNDDQTQVYDIVLFTTNKSSAFDDEANVSNMHLSNLKFHYPSANKSFDASSPNSFVSKYKSIYNVEPSKYATRGFDLTMDILLRLASNEDLYKASSNDIETEYVENKFRYAKKLFGGFYNEAVYVVKYDDLTIVEAKR